jgi:hypothetical protein
MGKYIWLPYFRGVVIKQMGLRITGVKKNKRPCNKVQFRTLIPIISKPEVQIFPLLVFYKNPIF